MTSSPDLSSSTFKDCLDTTFQVAGPSIETPVELALVQHEQGKPSTVVEQFSLLFHGPDRPLLAQGIYQFDHARMGPFEMFIVPIGRAPDHLIYQAVFNRLVDQSPGPASAGRV
jgi:hypothetical protein